MEYLSVAGTTNKPSASNGLAAGEQVTVQLLDGTVFKDEAGFRE
jgi:hypothetical protein